MEEDGYELFSTAHLSITERLIACLKNETMTDVALVGDDGIPVPASRYVLGCASAAFQPLLYGNFKNEGNHSTVNIREAKVKALTALVEFCCSDVLNTSIWADSNPLEIVQDAVALAKLAHTYEIPNLQREVKKFLQPLMQTYPPLACSVFDLADPVSTRDVYLAAQVIVREQPYVALKSSRALSKGKSGGPLGGMVVLSPNKLEALLSDNEVEADELFLFQQLVAWRDYNEPKHVHASAICKSMVQHLDLSSIDPNEIETTIMQSGFVSADMVVKALMAQAKRANKDGLAFASIKGPRGKKYAHILVQNAGTSDANGVYIHVNKVGGSSGQNNPAQERNLVYFIKKPSDSDSSEPFQRPSKTYILVQDDKGVWRLCDSDKNILYDWHPEANPGLDFPHSGWSPVSGELPRPECSWLRDPQKPKTPSSTVDPKTAATSSGSLGSPRSVKIQECSTKMNQYLSTNTLSVKLHEAPNKMNQHRASNTVAVTFDETGTSPNEEKKEPTEERDSPKKTIVDDVSELTKKMSNIKGMDSNDDKRFYSGEKSVMDDLEELQTKVSKAKGARKEKKKIPRKSSLMDDLEENRSSTASPDPILGTMVGEGGAYKIEKKSSVESIEKHVASDGFMMPKGSGVTASIPAPVKAQSSPAGCILPSASGDPVLVGCTAAMNPAYR